MKETGIFYCLVLRNCLSLNKIEHPKSKLETRSYINRTISTTFAKHLFWSNFLFAGKRPGTHELRNQAH